MAGKGDGEGEGNVLKLENQIFIIKYVILFTNIIEWNSLPSTLRKNFDLNKEMKQFALANKRIIDDETIRYETKLVMA
ncbi:hypothetical protein BDFB_009962 [Asbolus verrucosus]|uniref:Uncharacterized protein n=1 Tax=Asbolus verrucosus TaxID=1661398 RepID=A0A482VSG0_ASBVE|nr:hypothetical protein BDFB_009962 [Asbolus verrucosus]